MAKLALRLWVLADKVHLEAMNTHVESDEVLEGAFGAHTPASHRNLKGNEGQRHKSSRLIAKALSNITAFNQENKQAVLLLV